MNKEYIAQQVKPIDLQMVDSDMEQLIHLGDTITSSRCLVGNNVVDYFTFVQRLETKGKYNTNFYEFVANIDEFKKKKFIQTMFHYYATVKNKKGTKNEFVVLKEVYNICISAINIFRPLVAMEVYQQFKPTTVLDFCAGWGGRLVGACAVNVPNYIGIEINRDLKPCYNKMTEYLNTKSTTNITMIFENAATFDYESLPEYDMVLTSPPYYFIEKYANNESYVSKEDMNQRFYEPVIRNTYEHMKPGGHYCLNVNSEIYENVCVKLLGQANCMIPLKKSKRQNNYGENIYVYCKPIVIG
jgi:tRNA1(Val) A37 N6-methylase TrmN6